MAARRLIAVMLVLLFLSSLAAALAPVGRRDPTTTTTATEAPPPDEPGKEQGRLLRRTIAASAERPPGVMARVGDQLQLRVTVKRPMTVELARLGPTADADPLAPARFDVLLDSPGSYPVRELDSGKRIGTIEVSRRRPAPKEPDEGRAAARS